MSPLQVCYGLLRGLKLGIQFERVGFPVFSARNHLRFKSLLALDRFDLTDHFRNPLIRYEPKSGDRESSAFDRAADRGWPYFFNLHS